MLSDLNLYLERSRRALAEGGSTEPLTVVTGSSAADLDSVAASVAYAYLLDREGGTGGSVIAYLPISRENLVLRREVAHLLERAGLDTRTLVFADDIDLEKRLRTGGGQLILVDTQGHELAASLKARVVSVIDHHPGSHFQSGYPGGSSSLSKSGPWIVEAVGSACTLVAEQIFLRRPGIVNPQLATLLLAAVLLDTVNLDPNAGRATAKDREIAGRLMNTGGVRPTGLYEELVRARCDVEGLSSTQLLVKDFKERLAGSSRFGMSSVPILIDSWLRRDRRLERSLSGFLHEKKLELLVVLLYGHGGGFTRQLLLCSTDGSLLNNVAAGLSGPLGLTEIPGRISGAGQRDQADSSGARRAGIRCFAQRENTVSRKQIEPRLREILESL